MNHVAFPPLAPPNQPQEATSKPKKLRRISRACDFCHKRSIRCKPSTEDVVRCQNCLDFAVACTYNRPAKKRGIKSGSSKAASENGGSRDGESDARMLLELTNGVQGNGNFNVVDKFLIPEQWKTMVMANESKIRDLVDVYFEVVYPIFPLFHKPSITRKITSRDYLTDHSFFADIMSICALTSARARDGALFPGRWDPDHFQTPSSESFFAAAKEAMPRDLSSMRGLDWMRTCALLAVYGIQIGNIEIMHQYLGTYHSLVSMDSLHDEQNWPTGVGTVEIELRRRLFWSMYALEVYSSIVWGCIVRCRESQSHVLYPSEVDDESFSDTGYQPPNSLSIATFPSQPIRNPMCWVHGWNFTTDLYRILEHAMDDFHRRRPRIGPFSPSDLFSRDTPHQSVVLAKVMSMHDELPPRFKETNTVLPSGKGPGLEDKFSFQAANITATLQLVRMILFTSEDATVDQKCAIARDLLDGFAKIPIFFLRAISAPLLHHLAGIGSILGSVIEGPISESSYLQVREVLLAMAELLASLEVGITRTVGAASRLRSHITAIDRYMSLQRQADLPHSQHLSNENLNLNGHQQPHSHVTYPGPLRVPCPQPKLEQNPNIDPSLQGFVPVMSRTMYVINGTTSAGPYEFGSSMNGSSMINGDGHGMSGAGVGGVGAPGAENQFQLPQELVEHWPWNVDITHGFVNFQ